MPNTGLACDCALRYAVEFNRAYAAAMLPPAPLNQARVPDQPDAMTRRLDACYLSYANAVDPDSGHRLLNADSDAFHAGTLLLIAEHRLSGKPSAV